MNRKHPLYKGFILIREYPNCKKKKGDFEPLPLVLFYNIQKFGNQYFMMMLREI